LTSTVYIAIGEMCS